MKEVKIPDDARSWDAWTEFHCKVDKMGFSKTSGYGGYSPVILFETGELIITHGEPNPDVRTYYEPVGIELTTSNDLEMYLPDEDQTPVAKAWLDDGGMQYLLRDHETCRAVRLDGDTRYMPHPGGGRPGAPITFGIPGRFQYTCRAYIPGPHLPPVAHSKIKVKRPLRKAGYDQAQMEHIHMIVATGQAAMRLTNHEAVRQDRVGYVDPEVLLKCQTWLDVPASMLSALAHRGCTHRLDHYDYLLTAGGDR